MSSSPAWDDSLADFLAEVTAWEPLDLEPYQPLDLEPMPDLDLPPLPTLEDLT